VTSTFALTALVVLTGACNAVYDLEDTSLPPPPLPPTCPAIGIAPAFSPDFHQFAVQPCSDYTLSATANRGMASCPTRVGPEVAIGEVDAPVSAIVTPPVNDFVNIQNPRLVPEGDVAYIYENNFDANGSNTFGVYRPVDDTTWRYDGDLGVPFTPTYGLEIGVPSAGPVRHLMVVDGTTFPEGLYEIVGHQGSGWQSVLPGYTTELGVRVATAPNLSADGLRMVFRAIESTGNTFAVFYADRESLDARFGMAQRLEGVPDVADPFMSDDCARIYFSGLGSLLYVDQLPVAPAGS
jgi:hypothetical protein